MDQQLQRRYRALREMINGFERAVIAYSGGVDSSLVAYVAAAELGPNALAVTSGSAALKRSDLELAKTLAERWGMRHQVIVTDELSRSEYRANPVDRCFYCKTTLYEHLQRIAAAEGNAVILNGTNCDDLGDHRPGLVAAEQHGVRSPLVETGFDKAAVRALARELGLANADKPQAACLASRFPYGSPITAARLAQVERAEAALAELGFRQYRVRHHEDVARLEIDGAELDRAFELREAIDAAVRACGYRFVALDLAGFRSGSLNAGIPIVNIQEPRA